MRSRDKIVPRSSFEARTKGMSRRCPRKDTVLVLGGTCQAGARAVPMPLRGLKDLALLSKLNALGVDIWRWGLGWHCWETRPHCGCPLFGLMVYFSTLFSAQRETTEVFEAVRPVDGQAGQLILHHS